MSEFNPIKHDWKQQAEVLASQGKSWRKIAKELGVAKSSCSDHLRKVFKQPVESVLPEKEAKVLLLDIETAPLLAHVWKLWDNNVGLNQVAADWHLLSWAAKWLGDTEVIYQDQRGKADMSDDYGLCAGLQTLINQADFVVAQNGRKFDIKKINARCVLNGLSPTKPVRIIDTLEIVKKEFGFTSNKLEYLTDKLCTKHKKLKHKKFAGHELWVEVLKDNPEAWDEMEDYNVEDVNSLEEVYMKIRSWSSKHPTLSAYREGEQLSCRLCGSLELKQSGYYYTNLSKFPLYQCSCGAWSRGRKNQLSKSERDALTAAVVS